MKCLNCLNFVTAHAFLKLASTIFYQIYISHQMAALQKLWKMLFTSLKSSFLSRDIQIFVFLPSPLFLSASHCFRGWWKINLKVCDIINCQNKNILFGILITKKRYDTETLSNDRVLNNKHFYWKIMQKLCTRGYSQTPF